MRSAPTRTESAVLLVGIDLNGDALAGVGGLPAPVEVQEMLPIQALIGLGCTVDGSQGGLRYLHGRIGTANELCVVLDRFGHLGMGFYLQQQIIKLSGGGHVEGCSC